MINIIGLLDEHKVDHIELTTLEQNLSTYEELMNFISPLPKTIEGGTTDTKTTEGATTK